MKQSDGSSFYSDGLQFSCSRCSMCCRFDSGFVWLSHKDLASLAAGLKRTTEQVMNEYCRVVDIGGFRQLSLQEQANNDCVFWVDGACRVYMNRPLQCRTYPFWSHHLIDEETWNRAADHCPGMNIGPVHSFARIEEMTYQRRVEPPLNADSI